MDEIFQKLGITEQDVAQYSKTEPEPDSEAKIFAGLGLAIPSTEPEPTEDRTRKMTLSAKLGRPIDIMELPKLLERYPEYRNTDLPECTLFAS